MLTSLQKLYKGLKKTIPYKNTIFSGWTLSSPKGKAFQSFSIGYLTTFDQKKKTLKYGKRFHFAPSFNKGEITTRKPRFRYNGGVESII